MAVRKSVYFPFDWEIEGNGVKIEEWERDCAQVWAQVHQMKPTSTMHDLHDVVLAVQNGIASGDGLDKEAIYEARNILQSNAYEACERLIIEEMEGHITSSTVDYIRQRICDVFLISPDGYDSDALPSICPITAKLLLRMSSHRFLEDNRSKLGAILLELCTSCCSLSSLLNPTGFIQEKDIFADVIGIMSFIRKSVLQSLVVPMLSLINSMGMGHMAEARLVPECFTFLVKVTSRIFEFERQCNTQENQDLVHVGAMVGRILLQRNGWNLRDLDDAIDCIEGALSYSCLDSHVSADELQENLRILYNVCREYGISQPGGMRNGEEKEEKLFFLSSWEKLVMRSLSHCYEEEELTESEKSPSGWDDITSALINLATRTRSSFLGKAFRSLLRAEFYAREHSFASHPSQSRDAFIVTSILRTLSALWSGVYRIHFTMSCGWEVEVTERIVSCLNEITSAFDSQERASFVQQELFRKAVEQFDKHFLTDGRWQDVARSVIASLQPSL